jgi:hypothetical protein
MSERYLAARCPHVPVGGSKVDLMGVGGQTLLHLEKTVSPGTGWSQPSIGLVL